MINQIVILAILLIIKLIAAEEDLKQLYCQLNEFAKQRVETNLPVFPCDV